MINMPTIVIAYTRHRLAGGSNTQPLLRLRTHECFLATTTTTPTNTTTITTVTSPTPTIATPTAITTTNYIHFSPTYVS